jgi:hypothetical protein
MQRWQIIMKFYFYINWIIPYNFLRSEALTTIKNTKILRHVPNSGIFMRCMKILNKVNLYKRCSFSPFVYASV